MDFMRMNPQLVRACPGRGSPPAAGMAGGVRICDPRRSAAVGVRSSEAPCLMHRVGEGGERSPEVFGCRTPSTTGDRKVSHALAGQAGACETPADQRVAYGPAVKLRADGASKRVPQVRILPGAPPAPQVREFQAPRSIRTRGLPPIWSPQRVHIPT